MGETPPARIFQCNATGNGIMDEMIRAAIGGAWPFSPSHYRRSVDSTTGSLRIVISPVIGWPSAGWICTSRTGVGV